MTVFLTDQLFFVHVPKTAGTTLRLFLESHFAGVAIFPSDAMLKENPPIYMDTVHFSKRHKAFLPTTLLVRGHYYYPDIRAMMESQPTTLTMLRNPVSRAISEIRHHLRHGEHYPKHATLESMIIDHPESYKPQWSYFGRTVDEAIDTVYQFDWIGIQERFDESISLLCALLGWKKPVDIGLKNVSPEENVTLKLLSYELLQERLMDDLRFYLAARELFQARIASTVAA